MVWFVTVRSARSRAATPRRRRRRRIGMACRDTSLLPKPEQSRRPTRWPRDPGSRGSSGDGTELVLDGEVAGVSASADLGRGSLGAEERLQSEGPMLPADAGLLEAAERRRGIVRRPVDRHATGLDLSG